MCPVLAFTPEVQRALRWFDATHEIAVEPMSGAARYRRTGLPGPGNLGEQENRLMEALDFLRQLHDALITPPPKKRRAGDPQTDDDDV